MDSFQTPLIRILNFKLTFFLLESQPVRVESTPVSSLAVLIIFLYSWGRLFTNQILNLKWNLIAVALGYAFEQISSYIRVCVCMREKEREKLGSMTAYPRVSVRWEMLFLTWFWFFCTSHSKHLGDLGFFKSNFDSMPFSFMSQF